MKFTLNSTRLLVGAVALSPALALAQGNIVSPPTPPGMSSAQVAPAQGVSNVNPALGNMEPITISESVLNGTASQGTVGTQLTLSAPATTLQKPASLPPIPSKGGASSAKTTVTSEASPFAGMVVTPVSDSQLNRFVFPEPIEGIYFSEGAPLPQCPEDAGPQDPCKPVFLNGKRMMLLQLRAGASGPAQMLVHLRSGRIVTMNLAPNPGPGAVIRVDGAEDGPSDRRLAESYRGGQDRASQNNLTASEFNVEMLSQIARGELPAGFEPVLTGQTVRFEQFDIIPMSAWSNGDDLKAHMFQIKAHSNAPITINSGLFRTPNVKALALDRDVITYDEPAILYMLELAQEGR